MDSEDRRLIDECLSGRTEAFGSLVVRYQDRLYHSLVHVLGSRDDAGDVAQEAFVHAFQKLHTFQGRSAFYSWLFRIALNAAVTAKRKQRRIAGSIETGRETSGFEPIDERLGAPDVPLEVAERQKLVREAISKLPDDFRTALVLKEMDGLKYEEIAEIVGCPIGTVRSRIHRARSELREQLKDILGPDDDSE